MVALLRDGTSPSTRCHSLSHVALTTVSSHRNRTSAEQELKARNIAHARNLYDRAVTLLPRVDGLWLKFIQLEELLQNIGGARQVFERWIKWEPDDRAWKAYIKLELRYNEFERASEIHERWIGVHPEPKNWIEWARFEEDRGAVGTSLLHGWLGILGDPLLIHPSLPFHRQGSGGLPDGARVLRR